MNKHLLSIRILLVAFITSLALLSYGAYSAYGEEIQTKINTALLEALPDLEHSLAKL